VPPTLLTLIACVLNRESLYECDELGRATLPIASSDDAAPTRLSITVRRLEEDGRQARASLRPLADVETRDSKMDATRWAMRSISGSESADEGEVGEGSGCAIELEPAEVEVGKESGVGTLDLGRRAIDSAWLSCLGGRLYGSVPVYAGGTELGSAARGRAGTLTCSMTKGVMCDGELGEVGVRRGCIPALADPCPFSPSGNLRRCRT